MGNAWVIVDVRDGSVERFERSETELGSRARSAPVAVDHDARRVAGSVSDPGFGSTIRQRERHEGPAKVVSISGQASGRESGNLVPISLVCPTVPSCCRRARFFFPFLAVQIDVDRMASTDHIDPELSDGLNIALALHRVADALFDLGFGLGRGGKDPGAFEGHTMMMRDQIAPLIADALEGGLSQIAQAIKEHKE
jgi:hypothetical protein